MAKTNKLKKEPETLIEAKNSEAVQVSPQNTAETTSLSTSWDKVIRGIVYGLTFLLPILFTPWTTEPLEFSKQMLLFAMVAVASFAWLIKILVARQVRLIKTPLDVPIGIFLLVYLLASIFSIDRTASFLGFYGSFYGNFFQALFLVLFYYLVVNNFTTIKEIRRLFEVFFFSIFIALLFVVLQFLGLHVIPLDLAEISSFNTIGGLLTVTLFSALAMVLATGARASSWFGIFSGRFWKIVLLVSAFVILLIVNFLYAWVVALAGLILYIILQSVFSKAMNSRELTLPMILTILLIAFAAIQIVFPSISIRNIFNINLSPELRLDYATSKPVIVGAVTDRPILGTGPNTFLFAFSKYRDQDFNLSPFWNVRFDKAPSEAAEHLVGNGILGFLAFEILNLIFLSYGFFFLLRKRQAESWPLALTLFCGFAVLWLSHWFFFFNTVIVFSFWFLIAAFVAAANSGGTEKISSVSLSMTDSPRQTISFLTPVALSLVVIIVFLFFISAVYASEISYKKGLLLTQNPQNYDEAQRHFERAVRLNRFRPDYYLTYGEFLFLRINQELSKEKPNLNQIQLWLAASINTSRLAVNLSPANWTAWERLASLYSFARPLVAGVDKFIIDSLLKATENDTKNPILFAELGQIYQLAARRLDPAILGSGPDRDSDGLSDDQERALGSDASDPDTNGNRILDGNEVLAGLNPASSGNLPEDFLARYVKIDPANLIKAEEAFRKAVALKEDYTAAYYQLALALEQANKMEEAVVEMEHALERFPADITIKYDLGRLYFNIGRIDEAAEQFQDIVSVVPNNSNALFSLALSYERLGRVVKALDLYRKVLELNPGNQGLLDKVVQLEKIAAQQIR